MLVWLGAVLILICGAGLGQLAASVQDRRPRELGALRSAVGLLGTEIEAGTPLPQALRSVARTVRAPASTLLEAACRHLTDGRGAGAGTAWRNAVTEVWSETALAPGDREILLEMSSGLGASHRADQLKHLTLIARRLEAATAEAEDRRRRSVRLYRYLGWLGSLTLVILLV